MILIITNINTKSFEHFYSSIYNISSLNFYNMIQRELNFAYAKENLRLDLYFCMFIFKYL